MTSTRVSGICLTILCVSLLCAVQQTAALSYEVCESYGATWITDSPRLTGKYPYYSLLFFCNGGLNIEGKQVDACLGNGAACGQPAADAFCKYVGFDGAAADLFKTGPADEPARAVSGEWCVNEGQYADLGGLNRTSFEALMSSTANSPRCNRLTSATCFRSRDTLGKAFAAAQAIDAKAIVSKSVQGSVIQSAVTAGAPTVATPANANMDVAAVGGRRLLKGYAMSR
ncbi:hypothetical protein COCSUDRAFT_64726 [Coccomyxa subellipsoidea C-169]|uniref:Uncharacterized protein n=1 Tax=Coccomyxa subellipsoidea (strain C-169) TaxID=574566 RepID=I0Z8F9_COCSC|nr:hypothetical protein COCSUDRAFT_64726 [Coccomyxa subellipsoidea C-169]EIE26928.1 hypothetical protein COCSUDRAFT_64726 [Coccomyxa subellipsoidea C-169]|eukprot:XP_005651472.1 hypothetical protein COCSUDRAFT_64726 [Coccomyxa subellipsoidea C-169]